MKEPLFEPDLTTPARPRNANRLVHVVNELDAVADVAVGNLVSAEPSTPEWLRPAAARERGKPPTDLMVRWIEMFANELETVRRARNNVEWGEYISDGNVAAALQIAERILQLAKTAAQADESHAS